MSNTTLSPLQTETILGRILTRKGQFSRAAWVRDCKVKVGAPAIRKSTVKTVRAGISYDNMACVKEKRESGELPAENAGLKWATWLVFPHLLEHNTTKERYVRFYPEKDSVTTEIVYFMGDREVSFSEIEHHLLASEKKEEQSECIMVKLNDLVEVS